MKFKARTDLALEARELYFESSAIETDVDGVEAEEEEADCGIKISRVRITSKNGEETIGKPVGNYVTLELPQNTDFEQKIHSAACKAFADELKRLIGDKNDGSILVLGLGNRNITADALGPKVVDMVLVTRHLIEYMPEEIDKRLKSVCAVSPGVLGITGVETGEIVKGVCDRVKPALVIAIDALCSRRMERVNNTIQLADTGIVPGAGIGNRRMAINNETLGVPVIAIGVPTVVDAATIAGDTIDRIVENMKANAKENEALFRMLETIAEDDKYGVIKEVLKPDCDNFIVTPKEVDSAVELVAKIIADGINSAIHQGVDLDEFKGL